jgi:hypothetical protein
MLRSTFAVPSLSVESRSTGSAAFGAYAGSPINDEEHGTTRSQQSGEHAGKLSWWARCTVRAKAETNTLDELAVGDVIADQQLHA